MCGLCYKQEDSMLKLPAKEDNLFLPTLSAQVILLAHFERNFDSAAVIFEARRSNHQVRVSDVAALLFLSVNDLWYFGEKSNHCFFEVPSWPNCCLSS